MKESAGLNNRVEDRVQKNVVFILEESSLADVAFVERMNALLASGDIPGLFEGDEYKQVVSS
jgi:dynein heavy chain 1